MQNHMVTQLCFHLKATCFGLDIDHLQAKNIVIKRQAKGKAIPLQAWTGPEGSERLRLPDLKTIAT